MTPFEIVALVVAVILLVVALGVYILEHLCMMIGKQTDELMEGEDFDLTHEVESGR